MKFLRHAVPALALAGVAGLTAHPAGAASVFTFTGGNLRSTTTGPAAPGYTVGHSFTTGSVATELSALGYLAPAGPLVQSHEVGLFTFGGTQLADATVSAGTTATSGGYSYTTAITDENGFDGLLAANTTYLLGGYVGDNTDPFLDHATSVTGLDGFTYGSPFLADPGPGHLTAPTTYAGGVTFGAYTGPNLEVNASPAPEPSQVGMLALMGLGLGGLMIRARRRNAAA